MLRTKVVDDAFIVVIGSLALLHQALNLNDFRRNGHSREIVAPPLIIRYLQQKSTRLAGVSRWNGGPMRRG